MKRCSTKSLVATLLVATGLHGQEFAVTSFTIDSGGGTSTGNGYAVSGTIGQAEANSRSQGDGFQIDGGFWLGKVTVIQKDGLPALRIRGIPQANVVEIYWKKAVALQLHQSDDLESDSWKPVVMSPVEKDGNHVVTVPMSKIASYYRLVRAKPQ